MMDNESDVDGDFDEDFLNDLISADNADVSEKKNTPAELEDGFLYDIARYEKEGKRDKSRKNSPKNEVLADIAIPCASTSNIHQGDTDSSDDEDNRNRTESNLNDYGRTIKSLIGKDGSQNENKWRDSPGSSSWSEKKKTWSDKTIAPERSGYSFSAPVKVGAEKSDFYTDPVFGIRISKPVISGQALQERMVGRTPVSMAKVKQFTEDKAKDCDWVVAGVIIHKSPVKVSQKGSKYCIWRMSDLKPGLKTVSVFLFSVAFKDLFKVSVGTVVGILNPDSLDNREGSGDEAALSINNAQRVMILGDSKDFGTCKSVKKNGERCTVIVNKAACDVCVYHVQSEYRKCSQRSELQSTTPRFDPNSLRNKVLGKSEVFYGGQSFSAIPTSHSRKHVKKDKDRLMRLTDFPSAHHSPVSKPVKRFGVAANVEPSRGQAMKDTARLAMLRGSPSLSATEESYVASSSARFGNSSTRVLAVMPEVEKKPSKLLDESPKPITRPGVTDMEKKPSKLLEELPKPITGPVINESPSADDSKSETSLSTKLQDFDMFAKELKQGSSSPKSTKTSSKKKIDSKINADLILSSTEENCNTTSKSARSKITSDDKAIPKLSLNVNNDSVPLDNSEINYDSGEKSMNETLPTVETCGFNIDDLVMDFTDDIADGDVSVQETSNKETTMKDLPNVSKVKSELVDKKVRRERALNQEFESRKSIELNKTGKKSCDISSPKVMQKKTPKKSPKVKSVKKDFAKSKPKSEPPQQGSKSAGTKFVGDASRFGLGLNNAPQSPRSIREAQIQADLRKKPPPLPIPTSRGEANLQLINAAKIKRREEDQKQKSASVSKDLEELKQKRKLAAEATKSSSAVGKSSLAVNSSPNHPQPSRKIVPSRSSKLEEPPVSSLLSRKKSTNPVASKSLSPPTLTNQTPRLNFGSNGFIDLNKPIPKNSKERAKLNAMQFVKRNGAFKKSDPNDTMAAAASVSGVKRKLEEEEVSTESREEVLQEEARKRARFKELMEATSSHSDLLAEHDENEKDAYFNKLEKKEQLEEKMMNTFEVPCRAVTCLECKYTSFSASEICKEDGHRLKVTEATKRFFSCRDCGNRTVTLKRLPDMTCAKCQSSRWSRAPMMKIRKPDTAELSIRGGEEKFIGSAMTNGSLSLLVPIE